MDSMYSNYTLKKRSALLDIFSNEQKNNESYMNMFLRVDVS